MRHGSEGEGAAPPPEVAAGGEDTAGGLLRSAGAATASQLWRAAVAFATRVALRRLVSEAAFGLWHWAAETVFVLLAQLRDVGLPPQVVRSRPRPWGNFLAVELVWGGVLGLLVLLGAPLLARGFSGGGADVVPVLRLLVLFFLFEGLARVPLTFFEAELAVERALAPELVRNLCFALLAVGLAWLGWGIWSMVLAHVAATGLFAAHLWWRAWPALPLTWVRGGTLPLVRASLPLMLIALLFLLLNTLGFLILGARFPGEVLAHYGAALLLALLTAQVLELPLRRPLYPALVAFRDDPGRFAETYRLATVLLMAVHVPAACFLWLNARDVLVLLFGEPYAAAAPFLRLLSLVVVLQPFGRCAEDLLYARNEERLLVAGATVNVLALGGLGLLLTRVVGPVGMAWAHLLPLGELLLAWGVYRAGPAGFRRLLGELGVVYLTPLPLFAAAWALAPDRPGLRLALSALAGLLAAAVYLWRFGDGFVAFFRRAPR